MLATQEAEIRRITVQSQPGQIVCETLKNSQKPITKKKKERTGEVAQGVGPEFKPQKRKERKSSRQSPHIV
jgi:hypothetical protein